jgi:hypothetical protein
VPPFLRWREADQSGVPRNGLRFALEAERWDSAELSVSSDFEPVEFVKYVFRDGQKRPRLIAQRSFDAPGEELVLFAPDKFPTRSLRRTATRDPDDPAIWIHAQTYVAELESELGKLDPADALTIGRRFFGRLNLHTSEALWKRTEEQCLGATCSPQDFLDPLLVPDYQLVRAAIRGRLDDLQNQVRERTYLDDPPVPALGAVGVAEFQRLGDLQEELFGELTPADLARAFEQFTNGELRLPLPLTGAIALQPSSGFYFLWAEFWMFARGLGIAPPEGLAWARMLVLAQEIFVSAYAPVGIPGPSRVFTSYAAGNFRVSQRLDESAKAVIRAQYPAETSPGFPGWLALRFGQNVRNYLGGV